MAAALAIWTSASLNATGQEVRQLSLADCIEAALQYNLELRIERYNPTFARLNLDLAYAGEGLHGRIMDLVTRVENAYYDLVAARESDLLGTQQAQTRSEGSSLERRGINLEAQ